MKSIRLKIGLLLLLTGLVNLPLAAQTPAPNAPKVIGSVALAKGVVTARSEVRPLVVMTKGSPVYLKDIIETATRSFAVIEFNDGGKVTLRPDSRFDLNEYDDTAGQEKESFALIKGGLRAVTGAIGKVRPEQVTYSARNTTIGIRGTTLVIVVCKEGMDSCHPSSAVNDQGKSDAEDNKKFVDIIVVDKKGGTKQRITRQKLRELLVGVYVSVIDGAIRIETADWFIDMQAGDKCLIDYSEADSTGAGNQEVECFNKALGLEDFDVFLGGQADKITPFNLFDGSEIYVGDEICEIN